ncbi:MAG: PKD domain-containing protein, partial [Saprospiraceae bacterium]
MNRNAMIFEKIHVFTCLRRLSGVAFFAAFCLGETVAQGPVKVALTFTPPTCHGDSDGSATATASGGTAPYNFLWSNGKQTPTITGLPSGNYQVTVADNTGATAVGGIQVVQPAPLHFTVTVNMPSCNGFPGTMTLFPTGGNPPYDILWSNGTKGATAGNLLPGVPYSVKATDLKGCQLDTTVFLPLIDSLSVSLLIKKAECAGVEDGTATALVNPSGGNYHYKWNVSPNNTPQIKNLAPGTFVAVTVTDVVTGCTGTASGVIGTHTQVKINVTGTPTVFCPNDKTGTATATASQGTAPYTYAWQGPGVNNVLGQTITGLGAGAYAVTATDARGCTVVGSINIGVVSGLNASFSYTKTCVANSFQVKFTDKSTDPTSTITGWQWNITWNGGSFSSSQQNFPPIQIPNQSNGIARLVVTSAAGCTDTLVLPFKVDSLLDYKVVTQGYACDGGPVPVTVVGSPAFTYQWQPTDFLTFNPGPQNVLANPPATKTYLLVVSNGSCFDVDSVTITRQPLLTVTANDTTTCDTVGVLTATTNVPATLVWTNLAGDTINPLAAPAGIYVATATDSFHCVSTDTARVEVLAPVATASVPPNACPNTPFELTSQNLNPAFMLTYQWVANPPLLLMVNQFAANTSAWGPAGTYTVTLTVENQHGCTAQFVFPLSIQDSFDLTPYISMEQACTSMAVTFVNSSGFSGIWDFGDGSGASTLDSVVYSYAAPGTYTVTFDANAACVLFFSQPLTVSGDFLAVTAPDISICAPSANLVATTTQPATVTWTDLSGSPVNPVGVGSGMYIATATDLSGLCTDTATVTVTLQDSIDISSQVSVKENCNSTTINFLNT